MVEIGDDVLIYDIETQVFGKPNPEKDKLKIFGCYSYKTNKTYLLTSKEKIQEAVNAHKFLVGFNNISYDNPIILRYGIDLNYKIMIDLKRIFEKRAGGMKVKKGMLKDILIHYSLDFITRTVGVVDDETSKKEIDYSVFKKETWTKEEQEEIADYTRRDIEVTKKLYEWVEEYFQSFKAFLNDEDVRKKRYLTSSLAGFAYNAICKAMNWDNQMANTHEVVALKGGYVSYPAGERFEGNIYCLDFNSLYPHIAIQCNLFGREKIPNDNNKWTGGGMWKVEGAYNSDTMSPICKLFKKWYADRLEWKKILDKREYSIKIILNTGSYGILNTPYYPRVFDAIAGRDCPGIGRQWLKFTRKEFRAAGYKILYSDTDSDYILDVFNDKEKLLKVKDEIVKKIKDSVPFPQETFDMGIDDEITHMFFFKGGNKDKEEDEEEEMDDDDFINKPQGFIKKNYIYIKKILDKEGNDTGERYVVIKNLGIQKKSNSKLSQKIFWEYLVPQIIEKGEVKFSKTYFKNLIMDLLEKDITLAALRKDVGEYAQYKEKSPNSLQAQIAKQYGSGIYMMIPNTANLGVGKGKSYCTIDEFNERQLTLSNIDLSNVWKELDYFIKPVITKNIFEF